MNKLYLINNPYVFQGENKVKNNKEYFEGWYFKHTSKDCSISFIPGINIEKEKKSAFIQVITKDKSYFIPYDFEDFHYTYEPFSITIGNNYFSLNHIIIDINHEDLNIQGNLNYTDITPIESGVFSPNIMGPFSFLPFMECNHAILSLKHKTNGNLVINSVYYTFKDEKGYIEKDYGSSFPTSYIWTQGNNFLNSKDASFFLSVATIPISKFSFTGFICILYINGKEYKFTTYNGAKLLKCNSSSSNFNITLVNKEYKLQVYSRNSKCLELLAPKRGCMKDNICESLDAKIYVTLEKNNTKLFDDISEYSGLEIVN